MIILTLEIEKRFQKVDSSADAEPGKTTNDLAPPDRPTEEESGRILVRDLSELTKERFLVRPPIV